MLWTPIQNRDRLLTSEVAQQFFAVVVERAEGFMSDDHFTVDGTLIQAWASHKSFRKKDGSDDDGTNFHGQKRSNDTHEPTTDPDARLYKKSYGTESKLAYLSHALMENRNGLIAAAMVTQADGYAEREAALRMLADKQQGRAERGPRRITVGADKAYDAKDFVRAAGPEGRTAHHEESALPCHLCRRPLRKAVKAAGIAIEGGQRFGLHNLRHSLSNWLVNKAKVEPKTVQDILRHSRSRPRWICTRRAMPTRPASHRASTWRH